MDCVVHGVTKSRTRLSNFHFTLYQHFDAWLLLFSCSVVSDSLETPWTIAHQAPLSMGFSRQEYWSELPCPPPGDLPSPGIKPMSSALKADSLPSEPPGKPSSVLHHLNYYSFIVGLEVWLHLSCNSIVLAIQDFYFSM